MVRVPSATESMPLNRRNFASMQLALHENLTSSCPGALKLCSLPKQRHLLCHGSLQQSKKILPLLSRTARDCQFTRSSLLLDL